MTRGTRTVYPGERNKGLSSTFQPPEEGRSVQRPKRCNKHGEKDKDNSQKNVNEFNYCYLTLMLRTSIDKIRENGFELTKRRSKR